MYVKLALVLENYTQILSVYPRYFLSEKRHNSMID
jgi:hypothetical protein